MSVSISEDLRNLVNCYTISTKAMNFIKTNNAIQAIKEMRACYGALGLQNAKDIVDYWIQYYKPAQAANAQDPGIQNMKDEIIQMLRVLRASEGSVETELPVIFTKLDELAVLEKMNS